MQATKAPVSLHFCAGSPEPSLLVNAVRNKISCVGSYEDFVFECCPHATNFLHKAAFQRVQQQCFSLLPLPWPLISWEFRHFRPSEKRGELKRCNSHVAAYISVLKFLKVSVKSITHFKIVIALYMPFLFFKHCHSVDSIDSINVDTYPTDPIRSVWSG